MTQISAADRVTIDIQPDRWRLVVNGEFQAQVIAEASVGQPLRYISSFASTRRLPTGGKLPAKHIKQVVLGWSGRDEAWHLGLTLGPELAEARGSRWCEVARWPDPDTTLFIELAQQAGEALAETLQCPFHVIPPRLDPGEPPPPLRDLPLSFGLWTLERDDGLYRLKRSPRWAWGKLGRVLWYAFWVVVYVLLSVTTLTNGLALPNAGTMLPSPSLLPYLGLGAAVVLLGLVGYHLYLWLVTPDTITIDPASHTMTALRSGRERWSVDGPEVQSVYVTQVVDKDERKSTVYHGEINLHLGAERFFFVAQHDQPEELEQSPQRDQAGGEVVVALSSEYAISDLQFAALYIAEALGDLPCWYDQRIK